MTHSAEIEKALLGMMLSVPGAIDDAAEIEAANLYLDSHRRMLTVIRTMHSGGLEVNLVTFLAELARLQLTSSVGGAGYVAELTSDVHRGRDVRAYVRILKEHAARRQILALCQVASARAENGDDPDDILHALQGSALQAQAASAQVRATHISEFVVPTLDEMRRQMAISGDVLGIPTGIATLDEVITGWREGELTYVGALPGRGKTSFLLQTMLHAASKGFGVGCISLEMRADQLMRRLATAKSGIHAYKFRDPRKMIGTDWPTAQKALSGLGELPIWINDQSGLRPAAITSLARQMHAGGAQVIFVDFVQIISEDGNDRREAINRVSAALRDTSKALQIPFVVASQLARRLGDTEHPPTLRDLKESGNLEQDAHNVLLLHRPQRDGEWTGEDVILIAKQREGMTGPLPIRYDDKALIFRPRESGRAA
jgi:replicative DNA helicase